MNKLPPLKRRRSPIVACVIGFLFGGVGLAIYFRSLTDFFAPIAFYVAVVVLQGAPAAGVLVGALLAASYGFFRAVDSNQRLGAAEAPQVSVVRG